MLDSMYHMTLRLLFWRKFLAKKVIILSVCTLRCYARHNVSQNL